jgi:hypothetical protein
MIARAESSAFGSTADRHRQAVCEASPSGSLEPAAGITTQNAQTAEKYSKKLGLTRKPNK